MAPFLKNSKRSPDDRLRTHAERLLDELQSHDLDTLRRDAGKLAREVRARVEAVQQAAQQGSAGSAAAKVAGTTGKAAGAASTKARKAASSARTRAPKVEDAQQTLISTADRVAAFATVAAPIAARVARAAIVNRKVRRAALLAPKLATRTSPLLLGATVVGGGLLAVRAWRRQHDKASTDLSTTEHQEWRA